MDKLPGRRTRTMIKFDARDNPSFSEEVEYHVYALIKNGKSIYVGCTINPKSRESSHRSDKDFDNMMILKSGLTKWEGLDTEKEYTILLSKFFDLININGNARNQNV